MTIDQEVALLTAATTSLLGAVTTKKAVLDAAAATATTKASEAEASRVAAAAAVGQALAVYGTAAGLSAAQAIMLGYANTAQSQAAAARDFAQSAASVAQQDLSGVSAQALHRSPNPVTALFMYDTAKDSDGGAWTERVQDKSWMQEALNGPWLPHTSVDGWQSELDARGYGATLGAEACPDPTFATPAGWTPGVGCAIANGKLTVATAGSLTAVTRGDAVIATQPYQITVVVDSLTSGLFTVRLGSAAAPSRTINAPGTYTFTAVPAAGTIIGLSAVGATTATISKYSVKPITAFNTTSGSYYPSAVDGKFYRLWKNLLANSVMAGGTDGVVGAGAVAPTGWVFGGTAGSIAFQSSTRNPTSKQVRFTAAAQRPYIAGAAFNGIAGLTYSLGFYVEAVTSGVPVMQDLLGLSGGVVATVAYRKNGGGAIATTAVAAGDFIEILATVTTAGSMQWRYGLGAQANATGDVTLSAPQVEIIVGGAAASAYEAKADATSTTQTEVFRGNTAKFPKQAAIVAEAANVTIYDLTQPGRPMWMRFVMGGTSATDSNALGVTAYTVAAAAALNGKLVAGCGGGGGAALLDFVADTRIRFGSSASVIYNAGLARRNSGAGHIAYSNVGLLNTTVNAVAMTVLPNAPVDPVTNLPVPTIAVAVGTGSAGQLGTVLMNDGTAVNYSQPSNDGSSVSFNKRGEVVWGISTSTAVAVLPLQTANVANTITTAGTVGRVFNSATNGYGGSTRRYTAPAGNLLANYATQSGFSNNLLTLQRENPSAPLAGLSAAITGTYNTGWMVGDMRRVLAADSVAGSASGAELVTNGSNAGAPNSFSATTGWTGTNASLAVNGGRLEATVTSGVNGNFYYPFTTVPNQTYTLSVLIGAGSNMDVYAGNVPGNPSSGQYAGRFVAGATATITFTATSTTSYVSLYAVGTTGAVGSISSASVKVAVADRSVKAKPSSINGTLAMTAVAAAAQAVAYGGFSNDSAQVTNLVSNGDFATNLAGWADASTAPATVTWVGGAAQFSRTDANNARLDQQLVTVPGRTYRIQADIGAVGLSVQVGTVVGGSGLLPASGMTASGTRSFSFTATTTTSWLRFFTTAVGTTTLDNVSVLPADAIGSAANVIQEIAWSADLDVGTGDLVGSAWFTAPIDLTPYLPELTGELVTNKDFAGGTTGWTAGGGATFSVAGGQATITNVGGTEGSITQNILTAGKFYKGSINRISSAGASGALNIGGVRSNLSANGVATFIGQAGSATFGVMANTTTAGQGLTVDDFSAKEVGPVTLFDRSGPSGAYYRMVMQPDGRISAIVADGTTTRIATSTASYNDATQHSAWMTYSAGTVNLWVDGVIVATTTGAALLTLNNANALLTVGNDYTLRSAFPGTLALVKVGVTVPFAEQMRWAYAQERAMFQPGVQCCLADTGAVVDVSYDDMEDKVKVMTAANDGSFVGLVRTNNTPVPAGAYAKVAMRSGWRLTARTTTNPGVDVSTASLNLREQLQRKAEEASRQARLTRRFDVDTIVGQTDIRGPVGWEWQGVTLNGVEQREGTGKAWTRLFDGFAETVRFTTTPNVAWVQGEMRRSA